MAVFDMTENRSTITWDVVTTSSGVFTPMTPVDGSRMAGSFVKDAALREVSTCEFSTADADIAAGRVVRFATVDAMLDSLKPQAPKSHKRG